MQRGSVNGSTSKEFSSIPFVKDIPSQGSWAQLPCLQTYLTLSQFMLLEEVEAYLGVRGRAFWRLTSS